MVFDLGAAMRKKAEFESARLMGFESRRRARAVRLLAGELGVDEAELLALVSALPEEQIPAAMAERAGASTDEVEPRFAVCLAQAHTALVAERGDPTPHRLA
ncbi:hypothetical protein GGQ80_000881 [Sphingomonas jinjuensis]|uniref:Uncharacterized protein n=1 Tax=Sphingomonas jinjuensis TaxID=535907 RepID=A0A840F108_9SPHN|nr:hypothetical protein [Sphingomonas jinjuensis]MBB4152993.1 hypothetical protein [Sphingomonas jinjuensis]